MMHAKPNDAHLQRFLDRLEMVRANGNGWTARCPCPVNHINGDANPSLSINITDNRKILVRCMSQNCTIEDIVRGIGLSQKDLFPDPIVDHKPQRLDYQSKKIYCSLDDAIKSGAWACRGKLADKWIYQDSSSEDVFWTIRYETSEGKQYRPIHRVENGFIIGDPPGKLQLYNLPSLYQANEIIVVEGEKCADALISKHFVATTSAHGANAATKSDWDSLAGKTVFIIPDNDEPGCKYAEIVSSILCKLGCKCKIIYLPDIPEGGDIVDYFESNKNLNDQELKKNLQELIDTAPVVTQKEAKPTLPKTRQSREESDKQKQADNIVELVLSSGELFHTPGDMKPYVRLRINDHYEILKIGSDRLKNYLAKTYRENYSRVPSAQALTNANSVLAGIAINDGPVFPMAIRVAGHDNKIYVDLVDDSWSAVEISKSGWKIVSADNIPVRFIRKSGMLPLPVPLPDGSINELRHFVNLPDDDSWKLYIAWLIMAFRDTGPYPVLCVNGEQGTAKSSLCRITQALVDPNRGSLRRPPMNERDLMIAASNSRLVAYDNISKLSSKLCDGLCTLATGGGFATRQLFTDDDEIFFYGMRPIILNGIDDMVDRPDLADRSIHLILPKITENNRRAEVKMKAEFDEIKPKILGAIFDIISAALCNITEQVAAPQTRMADFEMWITAAEEKLGWNKGDFVRAYNNNRSVANETVLEQNLIGSEILSMMRDKGVPFSGTASDLLSALRRNCTDVHTRRFGDWPKSPKVLANNLRRLSPAFRSLGIEISFIREAGGIRRRLIQIENTNDLSSQ